MCNGIADGFTGTTYTTDKGSVLTVEGHNGLTGNKKKYYVHCSKCSEDHELFPDRFSGRKGGLQNKDGSLKQIPCGCSDQPKWTDRQDEIITQRILDNKMPFLKVVGSEGVKGRNRKFILECDTCSKDTELWPLGSITSVKFSLENNQIPCGCSKVPKWTDRQDEIITQRTLDKKMPHLKVIGGNGLKGNKKKFILECDTCSKDTELWSRGSITSIKGNLENSQIPCGCTKTPRWTEDQFKIKVQRACDLKGYAFHGWIGKFKGSTTKLDLENPVTGNRWQSTHINSFLSNGSCDPEASKQSQKLSGVGYGYYPHRATEQDNLYIIRFKNGQVIKVGRAFDVEKRIHHGNGLLKISNHQLQDIEILYTMTGTHQEVYDTEQWVHEELTERGFHASWIPWTTECFTEDSEDMIYRLLDESVLVEVSLDKPQ
ncbi:hypothetical protein VPBG_00043 [Vibrio phage helene 12B3]|uniref:hypothetical protein n=1 Tax=Vibrio phage helene 12B3 TaxID=573173 RepID=UPI0002C06658|nr:hypothetical protein VPBG_00043 [Vibrio phage helene 12B3]AGG57815.1 hypothetical protein VPBG_00043 [Vibrio phage helene 12B3]